MRSAGLNACRRRAVHRRESRSPAAPVLVTLPVNTNRVVLGAIDLRKANLRWSVESALGLAFVAFPLGARCARPQPPRYRLASANSTGSSLWRARQFRLGLLRQWRPRQQ